MGGYLTMKKLFNTALFNAKYNESKLVVSAVGAKKQLGYEETQIGQAMVINANALGYTFPGDDSPERILKSFFAATATYLSKVKVAKQDECVALVLSDTSGLFKFAAVCQYDPANSDEEGDDAGNWTYELTLKAEDIEELEKTKSVKKFLFGDTSFKAIFNKISYDVGSIAFEHDSYMYDACVLIIDTLVQVLDKEAIATERVDIEMPGYFICSVAVENDEKVFSITPGGAMKEIIKRNDVDVE